MSIASVLDDLQLEPTIYLLPECDSKEEGLEHLREVSEEIFEEQLNGWYRVPSAWPTGRGLAEFRRGSSAAFIR